MKKLILLLATSFTLVGYSQNTAFLSSPIVDFLSRSNLIVATYGIIDSTSKTGGGGIGLGYKLSDFVVPTLRFDYIGGRIWQPSGSLQLQVPVTIAGKFTVIPFIFEGIATPLTGKGNKNFDPVNIAGIGAALQLPHSHWYNPAGVIGDFERWTGAGWNNNQIRAGVYWKF